MTRPAQRRELAVQAVAMKGVSIALACRAFDVSETCYRYSPKLDDENEQIADLLLGLTKAKKTWGFGLCFLYLRNVQGHGWNHKRVYRIYRELEPIGTRLERTSLHQGQQGALANLEFPVRFQFVSTSWEYFFYVQVGQCFYPKRMSARTDPNGTDGYISSSETPQGNRRHVSSLVLDPVFQ